MAHKSQRSNAANKRRKGTMAVIIPWLKRFGWSLVFIGATFWIGSWLYMSGYISRAGNWLEETKNEMFADAGFRVENVMLEGRVYADSKLILSLVGTEKGDPLFALDPAHAKIQIEKMSWVQKAEVERRWPDTIYIRVTERQPLAFLQKDKKLMLMDSEGQIIETGGLSRFKNLPIVIGEGAQELTPQLFSMLQAEPEVFSRLETAKRVSDRRWDIVLKNGITLKFPEEDFTLALRRVADAQKADQILDKDIEHIDLRDQTRMIIRTRPGMVEEYKASLKPGESI